MTHDPHLSAALHELLSALTSVRATAAILAETGDLDPDLQARFHRNLHEDSERLAGGAEALVAFLDGSATAREQGIAAPQEEVEDWLAGAGLASGRAGRRRRRRRWSARSAPWPPAPRAIWRGRMWRGWRAMRRRCRWQGFAAALDRIGPDPGAIGGRVRHRCAAR